MSGVFESKFDQIGEIEVYPIPASATMTVKFNLIKSSDVEFIVYNVMGQKVYLKDGCFQAGNNEITLDINGLSAGVYILQLNTIYNNVGLTKRFSKQ